MDEAPIEPSDYHDIARVSAPAVSPDGATVAFCRQVPDDGESHERTVYTVPADGSGEPRRFTASEGEDAEPAWSPSGDRLAFVSDRGTEGIPQLRIVPAGGGESEQVTDVPGGVSDVAWAPDGSAIAFTQETTPDERAAGHDRAAPDDHEREEPDPRVIDRTVYRAFESYFDGARSHVYVVEVDGTSPAGDGDGDGDDPGTAVTRVTDGEYDHVAPAWGDADTLYCAVKRGTDHEHGDPDDDETYAIEAYDLAAEDPEPEPVTETTTWLPELAATADGRVAYTWTPEDRMSMRQTEIEVYDRATGETTRLTDGLDRTVAAVLVDAGIAWGPDERRVYFATPDEGRFPLRRADADGVEVAVGAETLSGFDVAGDTIAVTQSTSAHPGDVYAGALGAGNGDGPADLTRLSAVNADYLATHRVGEPEELRFGSDGHEIQGWVLTPPGFEGDGDGEADEAYPLVVEIHGGPHAMWTTAGSMWQEYQALAAAGYVVFWCNPRGSTGYGEAFATAIERDWGAVTSADVLAGADLVAARDGVDADQQFVTGGSFGGFMTAWLVGHTDRFAGAVTQRGVYDLASFYGSTDAAYKLVEGDFDTVPEAEPAFLFEQSPVSAAGDVETPTLIMHAEADYRVPICNGEYLFRLLRKHGVDTRLVRYPREGHELSRAGEPDHVVDRLERIVRWFDGYSTHHDAERALDREPGAGLSAGGDDDGNATGDDPDA
ncbi:MAG: prolyl oligopeptidase family serine peptidase [Haloarculaceae archaeon]